MMSRKTFALLLLFMIIGIPSPASFCYQHVVQGIKGIERKGLECGIEAATPQQSNDAENSSRIPLEEEDDDNNEKLRILHLTAFLNSNFLDLLYLRQHAIFQELYIEISTPPPRF